MAVLPFSSVTQLCLTLCDPMDCSTPGLPVHHQLPEPIQTHVHRAGDAIQPSHPLLSPSPPAFDLSQHQGLFQWVSSSHQVATVLEFQLSLSQKQLLLSLGEDVPKHLILLPPETSLKTAISKRSHEYNDEENRRGDKSSKILKVAKQMNHGYWLSMPKKAGRPSQQQGKLKTSTVKAWGRQENKLRTRTCPLSLRSVFQSCPAPCDPMDCSRPGSSVLENLGILQARMLEWVSRPSMDWQLPHPYPDRSLKFSPTSGLLDWGTPGTMADSGIRLKTGQKRLPFLCSGAGDWSQIPSRQESGKLRREGKLKIITTSETREHTAS